MAFLKTMVNIGMNISNDYAVPVSRSLEKNKDYEVREYDTNKYIVIKYRTIEVVNPSGEAKKKEKKKDVNGNDQVMSIVWKIMKYTQGENETKTCMKLIMPVFVNITTLDEKPQEAGHEEDKLVEVRVMVSLPADYQNDPNDPSKVPLEPPQPTEKEIEFEVLEKFKCYVRYKYNRRAKLNNKILN